MARYIDADDFCERLSNPPYTIYSGDMFAEWFDECFKMQPTADVEPVKHGRWDKYVCSECNVCADYFMSGDVYFDEEPNFCPNCGAKMDGDAE